MTGNGLLVLGLVLLLLPVPLAFVIRAPAGAAPDPWRVRRARLALTGFAVFVAAINLLMRATQSPRATALSLLIWSFMSWYFLGVVVFELRRRSPDPFPGQAQRSASLRPRHVDRPVPALAWWLLAAAWAATTGWFLLTTEAPTGGLILLLGAAFFVAIGPVLAGRAAIDAEPLLEGASAQLERAYAERRRMRAWSVFALMAVTVAIHARYAFGVHARAATADPGALFSFAIGLLAATALVYAILEWRLRRRIRRLHDELAAGQPRKRPGHPAGQDRLL